MAKELLLVARRLVSLSAEKEVERLLLLILPGTQFSGKTFAVGGYVRDQLLGLEAKDLDIVVEMKNGAEKLTYWLHDMFPVETTSPYQLGAGYPIWQITFQKNIKFSDELYETKGAVIEFADSQKESFPDPDSRQRITESGTIEEDVQRRDFTVNMLLRDLSSGELRDLTGVSQRDIEKGILRGHPEVDFNKILRDDPL